MLAFLCAMELHCASNIITQINEPHCCTEWHVTQHWQGQKLSFWINVSLASSFATYYWRSVWRNSSWCHFSLRWHHTCYLQNTECVGMEKIYILCAAQAIEQRELGKTKFYTVLVYGLTALITHSDRLLLPLCLTVYISSIKSAHDLKLRDGSISATTR